MMGLVYVVDVWRFDEFFVVEFYVMLKLCVDVFVVEQYCFYFEFDGNDIDCLYLWFIDGFDLLVCVRFWWLLLEQYLCIGCVVVLLYYWGKWLGEVFMCEVIVEVEKCYFGELIEIFVQSYLQKFYGLLGFEVILEEYVEDGILYVDMLKSD